jgi:hypothetical protein
MAFSRLAGHLGFAFFQSPSQRLLKGLDDG